MRNIVLLWSGAVCVLTVGAWRAPTGFTSSAAASAQVQRVRRDIRQVEQSPEELKNLRHAFFRLMKAAPTSCNDTSAKSEYDCWAAYHNDFEVFGCRHLNDLFWPWHRYHLSEFEQVLRRSDPEHPERVRDVTIPYWNWSSAPSGKDFPAAVEQRLLKPGEFYPEDCVDPTNCINPLWVAGRREGQTCQRVREECVREAVAVPMWRAFGGGVTAGQASDFEVQAHNFMHSRYIAGPMGNPTTAARDPIYWMFHSYIDHVWDRWQLTHQEDPCAVSNVPDPGRRLTLGEWPAATVTFHDVLCARDLGYRYELAPGPPPPALPSCPARGEVCVTQTPETTVTLAVPALPPAFDQAQIRVAGLTVPDAFSYDVWVLLHPASARYKVKDGAFVQRWRSTAFAVWRGGAHGAARDHERSTTMELQMDVTDGLKKAVAEARTRGLVATLVFTPASKAERSARIVIGKDVNVSQTSLLLISGGTTSEVPLKKR
jgi:hypothetical protein